MQIHESAHNCYCSSKHRDRAEHCCHDEPVAAPEATGDVSSVNTKWQRSGDDSGGERCPLQDTHDGRGMILT